MKFVKGTAISGKMMRNDIPSQQYTVKRQTMKFMPGQFVSDALIKKFNIDPKYFVHPDSIMARGSFEFAHEKKGRFSVGIIRDMNGMGDVLMASVIAKALKYQYGDDVEIWFTVKEGYQRILQHNPYVDRVFTNRQWMMNRIPDIKIDVNNLEFRVEVKDFERTGKIIKNRTSIYLEQMGLFLENKTPFYQVTEEERAWAKNWLENHGHADGKPIVGVQFKGSNISRTYPYMKELTELFPEGNLHFIELDKMLRGIYRFDLGQVGAIVEQCDVVVAPNSYIFHLAGALKKRAVVVFGNVNGKVWTEDYEKVTPVEIECPEGERHKCWWSLKCLPGTTMQEKEVSKEPECLNIPPVTVLESVINHLSEPKKILVVVLTYNYLQLSMQCINSIRSFHDYDVFVIDNNSEDGTQKWLDENNIDYISEEMTVPEAWNLAMKKAWIEGYDYVLLCNNDIILSPTYIDTVVEVMGRRKAHAVTGRVVNKHEADPMHFHNKTNNVELPIDTMIAGDYSALLISMDCVRDIGPFRHLAQRYQSDEDHLLRIRLSGNDIIKTYKTTFYHSHGAVFLGLDTQKRDLEWKDGVEAFKKIWNIDPYEERTALNSIANVKKLNPDWRKKIREPWKKLKHLKGDE